MDFKQLFRDVPAVYQDMQNQNAGVPSNQVTQPTQTVTPPTTNFLDTIGLGNRSLPFFQKTDPFLASIIGDKGAEQISKQGTGAGILDFGLTYALTGRPEVAYAKAVNTAGAYSDKRKKSIFDMIDYNKKMKEYGLMDYNALPNEYKVFGAMQGNPAFANYMYAKDLFTKEMKEFEYNKTNKDFLPFLKTLAEYRRPTYNTKVSIGSKNASDRLFAEVEKYQTNASVAQDALVDIDRLNSYIKGGFQTGKSAELERNFLPLISTIIPEVSGKLGEQESFDALIKRVVIPQVKQLGFNPTNVDLKFIVESTASLGTTTEGNMVILRMLTEDMERRKMLNDASNAWMTENIDMITNEPVKAQLQYNVAMTQAKEQIRKARMNNPDVVDFKRRANRIINSSNVKPNVTPDEADKIRNEYTD